MALVRVPFLLRHCTVAIFMRPDTKGNGLDRFRNAWNIARDSLTKQGYLTKGSEEGPVELIKLTGKGQQRERRHRNEGAWKNRLFEHLYKELVVEDSQKEDKPGGADRPPEDKPDRAAAVKAERMLVEARRAKTREARAAAARKRKQAKPKARPKRKTAKVPRARKAKQA